VAYSREFAEDVLRHAPKNKSQRQIAQDMNVSQGTVGNIFMGLIPSDEILEKWAIVSGQEPQSLKQRVKIYKEAVHLRSLGFLPDEAVAEILNIMEECEKEQESKSKA
jgi:transcriptional regulator with XRE-family HTH domain